MKPCVKVVVLLLAASRFPDSTQAAMPLNKHSRQAMLEAMKNNPGNYRLCRNPYADYPPPVLVSANTFFNPSLATDNSSVPTRREPYCANAGLCLEMASSVVPSRDLRSLASSSGWLARLYPPSAALPPPGGGTAGPGGGMAASQGSVGGNGVNNRGFAPHGGFDPIIRACLCRPGFAGRRCQEAGRMQVVDVDCGTEVIKGHNDYGINIDFATLGRLPGNPPPDTCPGRTTNPLHHRQDGKSSMQQGATNMRDWMKTARNRAGMAGEGGSGVGPPDDPNFNNDTTFGDSGVTQEGPPFCYSESSMALLRYWCQGKPRCTVNFNTLTIMHDSPPFFCPLDAMDKLGFYYRQPQRLQMVDKCAPGCAFYHPSRTCYCVTAQRGPWVEARAECLFKGGDAARQISDPAGEFYQFLLDNVPLPPSLGVASVVSFYLHPDATSDPEDARPVEVIKADQPRSGVLFEVDMAEYRSNPATVLALMLEEGIVSESGVRKHRTTKADRHHVAVCSYPPTDGAEYVRVQQTETAASAAAFNVNNYRGGAGASVSIANSTPPMGSSEATTPLTEEAPTQEAAEVSEASEATEQVVPTSQDKEDTTTILYYCPQMNLTYIDPGYEFPKTKAGQIARMACPYKWSGIAEWKCLDGGRWASHYPNFTDCRSQVQIDDALAKLNTSHTASPTAIVHEVAMEANRAQVSSAELPKIAAFIEEAVKQQSDYIAELPPEEARQSARNFLEEVSNLTSRVLEKPTVWELVGTQEKFDTATRVQVGVEAAALQLANKLAVGETQEVHTDTLKVKTTNAPLEQGKPKDLSFHYKDSEIVLPGDWLASRLDPEKKNLEVAFFGYNGLHTVLENQEANALLAEAANPAFHQSHQSHSNVEERNLPEEELESENSGDPSIVNAQHDGTFSDEVSGDGASGSAAAGAAYEVISDDTTGAPLDLPAAATATASDFSMEPFGAPPPPNRIEGLNSHVIGASVNFGVPPGSNSQRRKRNSDFSPPSEEAGVIYGPKIKFRNLRTVDANDDNGTVLCAYWNVEIKTWATDGCRLDALTPTEVHCVCNHLTNFAVLMDIEGSMAVDELLARAMTWITIPGCLLSIICLSVTAAIFTLVRSLRGDTAAIHRNLCISLAIAELILLMGLDSTYNATVCATVAAILHYNFLVVFAWMLLEGVHIYIMVTQVFQSKRSYDVLNYALALGVPAVIVAITAATDTSVYGTKDYCWLAPGSQGMLAFLIPIGIVLMINFVILIVALRKATSRSHKQPADVKEEAKIWAKGAASLSCLLGLTWIPGYFMIGNGTTLFAIIFTLLNSFQGVFIFLFYVVMNKRTKRETLKRLQSRFPIFQPLIAQIAPDLSSSGGTTKKGTSSGTRTTSASNSEGNNAPNAVPLKGKTTRSTLKWLKWKYTLHITKSTDSAAPFNLDNTTEEPSSPTDGTSNDNSLPMKNMRSHSSSSSSGCSSATVTPNATMAMGTWPPTMSKMDEEDEEEVEEDAIVPAPESVTCSNDNGVKIRHTGMVNDPGNETDDGV